jgi:hypothetical protein
MQHRRFGGPSDDDDGRGFIGFNQLDGDRVDCCDWLAT